MSCALVTGVQTCALPISGERVRLRFINGSAMSHFDVRIPGLKMTVVAAYGQYVHPVTVDEFRIATAETFDVIVEPSGQDAFTIFAQDRSEEHTSELQSLMRKSNAVSYLKKNKSNKHK